MRHNRRPAPAAIGCRKMNCSQTREYINDRVLGEDLPGSIGTELARHLAGCPDCRRRLEETERVWRSLEVLDSVHFPAELSRRVITRAGQGRRPLRLPDRPFYRRRLILAAASLVLVGGLLLVFYRLIPSGFAPAPENLRSASTFSRQPPAAPDLSVTLDEYLEEAGNILDGIAADDYPNWSALLAELVSRDIQGRSNYLLENENLGPRARSVVEALHQAFWSLLQTGRGREDETIRMPPGVNPALLRSEIANYRIASPKRGN